MKNYKIAVIAGDGIGPEVINEGVKVLNAVAELDGIASTSEVGNEIVRKLRG